MIKNMSFKALLNSPSVIVGGSKSGKTTIIKHILYDIADSVSLVYLVTCNRGSAEAFSKIIPWSYTDPNG